MNATDQVFSTSGAAELTERQIDDVARNYRWAFGQQERREPAVKVEADPAQLSLLPPSSPAGCSQCGRDFVVGEPRWGFSHCHQHEGFEEAA